LRSIGALPAIGLEALNAAPVVMSSSETYTALQRNTIDGAWSGMDSFDSRKWFEVTKYLLNGPLNYLVYPVVVNEKWFQTLTDEQQKIISESASEAVKWGIEQVGQAAGKSTKKVEEAGVEIYRIPTEELGDWKKAFAPVEDAFIERAGEKGKRILELAKKYQ
jgi:TRAP-type C4-dicarboxylate transport system substrate-binding protein